LQYFNTNINYIQLLKRLSGAAAPSAFFEISLTLIKKQYMRSNEKTEKIVLSKTQKRNKRKNRFFKKTQSYLYYPSTKVLKQRKEIQYIYSKSAYSTKVLQIFNL